MKRKYKHEFVTKTWPIFEWRQCLMCKDEFRREQGWVTVIGPFYSGKGIDIYLCNSCATSKSDAEQLFKKHISKNGEIIRE